MELDIIKQKAVPILQRYGVEKAFVFGSYAREEQNSQSDIDILIEYAPGISKSLFTRVRLINELEKALHKDVDLVTEQSLSPYLKDIVLKEKKAIL